MDAPVLVEKTLNLKLSEERVDKHTFISDYVRVQVKGTQEAVDRMEKIVLAANNAVSEENN